MKKTFKIFLLLGFLLAGLNLNAQTENSVRINEFMVINTESIEDAYGQKSGWIELINSAYGTISIGGCYLTNDPNNLTKYLIPKGDVITKIKPQQHILFWADNQPNKGSGHLNFTLTGSDEILFVGSDGLTIIDRIKIPHNQLDTNVSYGRYEDGIGCVDGSSGWNVMQVATPLSKNTGSETEPAEVVFKRVDPYGIIMAITAMGVVFIALILLYISFKYVGQSAIKRSKKNAENAAKENNKPVNVQDSDAEQLAAIAAALNKYFEENEIHDLENTILTINKVTKNYSPWSSKIYTLRETPQKK